MANKVGFYTAYDRPVSEPAPTGDGYEPKYEIKIDKDTGHKDLHKTGVTNMYAKIQESAEECKIENILARAGQGDLSAFTGSGKYADVTEQPKTLAEAQSMIQKVQNEFNTLPLEIRAKFNHSVSEYVAAYGSEEWAKNLGIIKQAVDEKETKAESSGEGGNVDE